MPKSSKRILNKHEQEYWDKTLTTCINIMASLGFAVYPETIFKDGRTIGAFRSLLKSRTYPKGRLQQKVVDLMYQDTEVAYIKEYL